MSKELTPITREEKILHAIATDAAIPITPVTRKEKLVAAMADGGNVDFVPATREEYFLDQVLRIKQPHALVEFISYYGQVMLSTVYTIYDTINAPVGPSRTGYVFERWDKDQETIWGEIRNGEEHVIVRPIYVTSGKEVTYTVQYSGVGLESYTRKELESNNIVVEAPDVEGLKFAGWRFEDGTQLSTQTRYLFKSSGNITLVAEYVSGDTDVVQKPVIAMTGASAKIEDGKNKLTYISTKSVPEGYEVLEYGLIFSANSKYGEDDWRETFEIEGDNVSKVIDTGSELTGIYSRTWSINEANRDLILYGRGYMLVKDAQANTYPVYSDNRFAYSFNNLVENRCY